MASIIVVMPAKMPGIKPSSMAMMGNQDAVKLSADWRSLRYFNFFRLIIAIALLGAYFFRRHYPSWPIQNDSQYLTVVSNYVGFSIVVIAIGTMAVSAANRPWPHYNRRLTLLVLGDVVFISMLMHASGGVRSGFGLLLIVAIAAASLVSQGRQALIYAGFATIGVLLEQSYHLITVGNYEGYSHALLLSASFFATTGLAHYFAQRSRASEELASQRSVDLENLATINQLVIRDMPDGVLVVDRDFRLRHHNSQSERLLGQLVQRWKAFGPDDATNEVVEQLRHWMDDRDDQSSVITAIGGRELRLRFLPIGADHKQGAVVFVEDWSRVQNQAQQIKLVALGRLTASIAHEIRNPLSSIGHASQLLLEDEHADPTTTRLLQIIQDNVRRLDSMVQDVMQLNRRDRAQVVPLPIVDYLREFSEQFCQVENIPPEGVLLGIQFAERTQADNENEAVIAFDRHQLHQILWNLCRNGWRHGNKHTGSLRLLVSGAEGSTDIVLDVRDDGPGIADELLPRLFEPFFTTEASGTGLGLYIARELCAANDAKLEYVKSPQGGWFRIYTKKYGS